MKAYDIYHYCHISVKRSQKIDKRILPYTDLTFVLRGRLRYTVNKETFDLEAGDALFAERGDEESREAIDEAVEYVSFNFNSEPLSFPTFAKGIITPAIKSIVDIYPAAHMYDREDATAEKCLCMLNYILLELEDSRREKGRFFPKVSRIVNHGITLPLSLSDISRELGVTKEYLATVFKKECGKTVSEYVNEQKMSLARTLIENEEMPLCRIAEYLGYNNYNYFCRVFKKTFGISPTKVRFRD